MIKDVWDGENLMLTFRRSVPRNIMSMWWELCGLLEDIGDPSCMFCNENESIHHLFFECCVSSNVWLLISVGQ